MIKRLDQKNMDKTLDEILTYLKTVILLKDQNYVQYLDATDIFFYCYGSEKALIHNYTEPKLYLEKLYNDGYVNFNDLRNEYQINLNGIEFINNGGYKSRTWKLGCRKIWEITKIIAVFLNAILLLLFAYYSFLKEYDKKETNSIKNESLFKEANKCEILPSKT